VHRLVGTNPANKFYHIWEELGVAPRWNIVDHEQYMLVEGGGGKVFTVYADIDRLEQHMKELAPEDKDVIEEFIKGVRDCAHVDMPIEKAPELYGRIDGLRMIFTMFPLLRFMRKWGKVSSLDFARRFKNPFLRPAFSTAFLGDFRDDFPMLFMLMTLAWLHQKAAGYLVGGGLALSGAIERRYFSLGGELHCKSRVDKILVKNDKAVGVRLADGTEHRADIIISAADGHTTIFDMLDGRYIDEKIRGYYDNPKLFPPLVYIGLGVARSFENVPSVVGMSFPLDKPITIAGQEHKRLGVQIYNFDPTLAPKGKTVLKVQFNTDYDYWKKLRQEPERYNVEKEQIAEQVITALDQHFPGLATKVEMHDVATPVTWERYTGNWRGSYEGWLPSAQSLMMRMSKTLPGLDNFYMAGQWVEPGGGLPTAAMSGRNVTQIICKKYKRPFVTAMP
jgi:phytoene dehydrogenase-like protein